MPAQYVTLLSPGLWDGGPVVEDKDSKVAVALAGGSPLTLPMTSHRSAGLLKNVEFVAAPAPSKKYPRPWRHYASDYRLLNDEVEQAKNLSKLIDKKRHEAMVSLLDLLDEELKDTPAGSVRAVALEGWFLRESLGGKQKDGWIVVIDSTLAFLPKD